MHPVWRRCAHEQSEHTSERLEGKRQVAVHLTFVTLVEVRKKEKKNP
jgi:hypothetical protein